MKEIKTPTLKQITLEPVSISIEPKTRLLSVKQGKYEIKLTRDQVIGMKKLRDGKMESNVYTSSLLPRNRFQMAENGQITVVCKDDWEDNVVVLNKTKKYDDFERVVTFVDNNRAKIAWDKELRRR